MKIVTLDVAAEILAAMTETSRYNDRGLLIIGGEHPDIGDCAVIQGAGDGAVIVQNPGNGFVIGE